MHSNALRQTREEALAELALVRLDRVPAERLDVLDRGDRARQGLVGERAALEAVRERLVGAPGEPCTAASARAPLGSRRRPPRAARRTCTASRGGRRRRSRRRRSGRAARSARHRPRRGRRRRARGRRSGRRPSACPTAFDAHGKATTRVRDESCRSSSARSSRHSSSTSTNRTTRSRSRASSSQGATFASWSSRVTTTSSPAFQSRAAVRESAKLSVVMFAPKPTSSGVAPRKRAAVSWASSTTSSLRRLVSKGPPRFAFDSRR